MFHHDNRDYAAAASEAGARARVKMEEIVQRSQANAAETVEKILERRISDTVAPARLLHMSYDTEGRAVLGVVGNEYVVHDHAMGQILVDAGVPKKFAEHLRYEAGGMMWGRDLLARNVNEIFQNRKTQRNLLRVEAASTGDRLKGFLSDKFRRLDSRLILDAFIGASNSLGLVPYDGYALETKCRIRTLLPIVFEPIDNEVMLFGLEFGNSDYGDGGLTVGLWSMRIWCTNLAITDKALRQVHLGARLPDDVAFSARTHELDTLTMSAAVTDIVKQLVTPDRINLMMESVRTAAATQIKGHDGIDKILARALDKTELQRVKAIHESDDVANLPPGNTMYRLSNALTWLAQSKDVSAERKLDLQQIAGGLINPKIDKNTRVA